MSRNDTKFAFRSSKLPQLLNQMYPFYRVLSIDGLKFMIINHYTLIQKKENFI